MANKIYVGNLSYETTEEDLKELFKECGNIVSVKVITDAYTGNSRGFAFVELETDDAAQKAITACNGKELKGKAIKVDKARDNRTKKFRPNDRRF